MTTNIYLEQLARKNNIRLDYVLFKDELRKIKYKDNLNIIINMSNTGHQGTHWVALHTFNDKAIYFDSFGIIEPVEVSNWAHKVIYNDYQIQHLTDVDCGQLCLLFLGLMQNKITLQINK